MLSPPLGSTCCDLLGDDGRTSLKGITSHRKIKTQLCAAHPPGAKSSGQLSWSEGFSSGHLSEN